MHSHRSTSCPVTRALSYPREARDRYPATPVEKGWKMLLPPSILPLGFRNAWPRSGLLLVFGLVDRRNIASHSFRSRFYICLPVETHWRRTMRRAEGGSMAAGLILSCRCETGRRELHPSIHPSARPPRVSHGAGLPVKTRVGGNRARRVDADTTVP
jgi:hypothetical protein